MRPWNLQVQEAMRAGCVELGLGACYGYKTGVAPLFSCGRWHDGATLSVPGLKIAALEGEIGLVFDQGLPPRAVPYTEAEVWIESGMVHDKH
jgi:hypothetical protein